MERSVKILQKFRLYQLVRTLFAQKPSGRPKNPPRRRIDLHPSDPSCAIYAVGDVHGCLRELREAEQRIVDDIARHGHSGLMVLLGDYIDRGPKSAGVLEHLISPPPHGLKRLPLCGNHDVAFLKFIQSPSTSLDWIDFGGRETLFSYGIDAEHIMKRKSGVADLADIVSQSIPEDHIRFLRDLPVSVNIGNFLFVHAGIRPGLPIDQQTDEDFLWIREPFLSRGPGIPLTVVHGHSINSEPIFSKGRIGIDTGAYLTGKLAVLKIHQDQASIL